MCHRQITPLECQFSVRIVSLYSGCLRLAWSAIGQLSWLAWLGWVFIVEAFKGPFYQQDRDRGSKIALSLSDHCQGWCLDGCADRGRRAVRKNGWLNDEGDVMWCDVTWVSPQLIAQHLSCQCTVCCQCHPVSVWSECRCPLFFCSVPDFVYEMWCSVVGCVVACIVKDISIFLLRIKQS